MITKHRFSAFYGTDLEIILRGLGVTKVVITGVGTENCCHATATSDYRDLGYGAMTADEAHRATLISLAASTATVMTTETFIARATPAA